MSAEVVDAPFRLIPPLIENGTLDATVWYGDMALAAHYMTALPVKRVRSGSSTALWSATR